MRNLRISAGILVISVVSGLSACRMPAVQDDMKDAAAGRKKIMDGSVNGDIFPDNVRVSCYDTTAIAPGSRSVKMHLLHGMNKAEARRTDAIADHSCKDEDNAGGRKKKLKVYNDSLKQKDFINTCYFRIQNK